MYIVQDSLLKVDGRRQFGRSKEEKKGDYVTGWEGEE
jgi:hypothetical protein